MSQPPVKKKEERHPSEAPLSPQIAWIPTTPGSSVLDALNEHYEKIIKESIREKEIDIEKMREELKKLKKEKRRESEDQTLFLLVLNDAVLSGVKKFDKERIAYASIALVDVWHDYLTQRYGSAISKKKAAADAYFMLMNKATDPNLNQKLRKVYTFMANYILSYYMLNKKKFLKLGLLPIRQVDPSDEKYDHFKNYIRGVLNKYREQITNIIEGGISLFKDIIQEAEDERRKRRDRKKRGKTNQEGKEPLSTDFEKEIKSVLSSLIDEGKVSPEIAAAYFKKVTGKDLEIKPQEQIPRKQKNERNNELKKLIEDLFNEEEGKKIIKSKKADENKK